MLVTAWLVAACPRYARQPPPHVESSTVTVAPSSHRTERAAREVTASPTCISGVVKTSGTTAIPVARARIRVARGDETVGETSSDDNGHFNWCTPRPFDGVTVRTSVHVEKSAFASTDRDLELTVGKTADLELTLSPVQ